MKTVFPRCGFFLVVALFGLFTLHPTFSFARKETPQIVKIDDAPAAAPREGNLVPEQILGQWDFEGSSQGWTVVDATAQTGVFTHVDNFAGLALPYVPLNGAKSLWCGLKPGDNCAYLLLPGYGNSWDQHFTSVSFVSSGNEVIVEFNIRYDTEPTYDNVTLEYQPTPGSVWTTVATFNGAGTTAYSALIPDVGVGTTFRLRFRFVSDNGSSDEDGNFDSQGAYVIDNLVVRASGGTIDSQTFETESIGALTTADGDWTATGAPAYGVHAALFSGATVLQEDPGITNLTQLWGFFNNSTDNYACQGHPEQPVVPYGKVVDSETLYFNNEIWSPPINIQQDVNGFPVSGTISMTADVYRGMTLDALVFYRYRVRSLVGGCWRRWLGNGIVYYDPDKTWNTHTIPWTTQIEGGATQIQVAVGVIDLCSVWCGVIGNGACHSHGPLIDNVKVTAPNTGALVVTNTNNSGAGSLRQAILDANANADYSAIVFEIPGAGPHVIAPFSELPAITQRVVIDGYTQAGASPNTNGSLQGSNAVIKIVLAEPSLGNGLTIAANQCTIRGLAIRDLPGVGIYVTGANNIIKGCFIGLHPDGTTVGSVQYGVWSPGVGTLIGGESAGDRNVISSCTVASLFLAGADCTVQNNIIGTDASGTLARGSIQGIRVVATSSTITGNLISGNSDGILMASNPSEALVTNNRIGTDVTGTSGIGNTTGIRVHPQGMVPPGGFVTIGLPSEGNEIAFNGGQGIVLSGSSGLPGISASIEHNEIHSNGKGVVMPSPPSPGSTFALLTRNSIHSNVGLGIDLLDNGLTANDVGDGDSGPNGLQNFPVITSVSNLPGGGVAIAGTLNSTSTTDFAIECYASPSCDASGYGEGTLPIDVVVATTSPVGNANFNLQSPAGIPGGWYVTATATHVTGRTTSEFSQCVQYLNTPLGNPVLVVPVDESTLESPVELTFQNVTNPGNTSIVIGDTGPPPPGSLSFGDNPTFYELSTTATFTGSITVCIEYDENDFTVPETSLQLLHYNGTAWVDITTSLDTVANILCGTTTSLSPFAIAQPNGPTSVPDATPEAFALHPCAPNPFNPSTTIRYDVPRNGVQVSIAIFDVTGRRIRTLVDSAQPAGTRTTTWDGRDERGQSVASGVYFYRMLADQFMQTRKMVLLK